MGGIWYWFIFVILYGGYWVFIMLRIFWFEYWLVNFSFEYLNYNFIVYIVIVNFGILIGVFRWIWFYGINNVGFYLRGNRCVYDFIMVRLFFVLF